MLSSVEQLPGYQESLQPLREQQFGGIKLELQHCDSLETKTFDLKDIGFEDKFKISKVHQPKELLVVFENKEPVMIMVSGDMNEKPTLLIQLENAQVDEGIRFLILGLSELETEIPGIFNLTSLISDNGEDVSNKVIIHQYQEPPGFKYALIIPSDPRPDFQPFTD